MDVTSPFVASYFSYFYAKPSSFVGGALLQLLSKENIILDNADRPLFFFILPLIFAVFVLIMGFMPLAVVNLLVSFTLFVR